MGQIYAVSPFMGERPLFVAFVVVILGGMGSIPGAALGGVLLGFTESLLGTLYGGSVAAYASFGVVILLLIFRPVGPARKARVAQWRRLPALSMTSNAEAPPVVGASRAARAARSSRLPLRRSSSRWPYVVDERFVYHIAIMVCFAAIGACSLHLIIRTGHVSLCHSAFIGVGAYASANVVMTARPARSSPAWRPGRSRRPLLALLIGPIILRLTGKYFVLITFLLGEIVRMVFVDWQSR